MANVDISTVNHKVCLYKCGRQWKWLKATFFARFRWEVPKCCKIICTSLVVITFFILFVIFSPFLDNTVNQRIANLKNSGNDFGEICSNSCRISVVESYPIEMDYPKNVTLHKTIYQAWMDLIASAETSIEVATYFIGSLRRQDLWPDESAKQGEDVFAALLEAGRHRGVQLKFAHSLPRFAWQTKGENHDTEYLSKNANAQVRYMEIDKILGSGIFHTKLWLVDRIHAFVGSTNMDWRSLTQKKELGLLITNCSCIVNDFGKIFDTYWKVGDDGKVPDTWSESLRTKINLENPLSLTIDDNNYRTFIPTSPPALTPEGRTDELDALIHYINKAEKFVYISVKSYFPLIMYTPNITYWPVIDNALRSAAINRKVTIRLLICRDSMTPPAMRYFLKSLAALNESYPNVNVEVRMFIVPTNARFDKIPSIRKSHSKYMVSENAALIGTSNWIGDYFVSATGISMVLEKVGYENTESVRQQIEDVFLRDWNSQYAHPLKEIYPDKA